MNKIQYCNFQPVKITTVNSTINLLLSLHILWHCIFCCQMVGDESERKISEIYSFNWSNSQILTVTNIQKLLFCPLSFSNSCLLVYKNNKAFFLNKLASRCDILVN